MNESGVGDSAPATKPRWLTIANVISLARLAATPFSLAAVLHGNWQLAGTIFAGAVASDFLDGIIARRRGTVSSLGGVLDHTADAVFVAVTLWGIAYLEVGTGADVVPGILPWFIALAFLQYFLDSKALAGQPLRTSRLGRANGIAYYVVAGTVIGKNALGLDWLPGEAIYWAALLVLVSTLVSMFDRLRALTRLRTD
ncbi:MAG: CDP-alcohol phosphatidyltransferase family protein [Gammaproteobacteria bacterium]|nr:CDP-alcohol phosphatidyltransferase family protein [Gammaproteobacteria bacterium]MYF28709.1 CDP-alcohol phosphatidyltransferase family protein [Gammaproteobacteria bacterium]MYK47656.1 CDP-alcohol phosphatidyltransferase family protein [Gammaproteobacteria bacterium]